MFSVMRTKLGPWVVGGIIGFIAFVFIFSGVFTPQTQQATIAGTVNGDSITLGEFNRELSRRMEFFKTLNLPEEQLKSMGIREGVFRELVNRKLILQDAERLKLYPSDAEIRTRIQDMPVFQETGSFSKARYRQVLEANGYTLGAFEKMMREDLMLEQWRGHFKTLVRVSEEELRREFQVTQESRSLKYVHFTLEAAQKGLGLQSKPGEQLAPEKMDQLRQLTEKSADQVASTWKGDAASEAHVSALIKKFGLKVQSTGALTLRTQTVPGLGDVKPLLADAFAGKSPIDPKQGGKAKKYLLPSGVLVAVLDQVKRPESARIGDDEKVKLMEQVTQRKEQDLYETRLRGLHQKASIKPNTQIVLQQNSAGA